MHGAWITMPNERAPSRHADGERKRERESARSPHMTQPMYIHAEYHAGAIFSHFILIEFSCFFLSLCSQTRFLCALCLAMDPEKQMKTKNTPNIRNEKEKRTNLLAALRLFPLPTAKPIHWNLCVVVVIVATAAACQCACLHLPA